MYRREEDNQKDNLKNLQKTERFLNLCTELSYLLNVDKWKIVECLKNL